MAQQVNCGGQQLILSHKTHNEDFYSSKYLNETYENYYNVPIKILT